MDTEKKNGPGIGQQEAQQQNTAPAPAEHGDSSEIFGEKILGIVRSKASPKVIHDQLDEFHAGDIAAVMPEMSCKEREVLYRLLDLDTLAEVFEYADEDAVGYIKELDPLKAARVLEKMEPDDAVDLLKQTDLQSRKAWLELMDAPARAQLQNLAAYDEDTIGSRMTTNFVTLQAGLTIKEAMSSLIDQAAVHDNISVLYALDENGIYYGAVDLKDLIIARRESRLEDLISTAYPYVYADEKIEDCLGTLKDYSEESIPVLSDDNRIVGVVTASDVIETMDAEMSEDYAKLGGLSAEEDLKEPVRLSMKKRLPWLILLMYLGLIVSSVIGMYEEVVAKLTLIMAFQSMILDMSGNVGTQSLAVTIRVLMDEKLTAKEKTELVFKEMRVGFLDGIVLAVLAFGTIGIYIMLFRHYPALTSFAVSACIGLSLILAMVVSSLVGTGVPILFKKVGVDPAAASGPLITTITDLVGVVSYYSLAWIMLIRFLHM
ncbi:MAG: magnesium transporter [Lachnospiraceae bacterium]|jgi:magnesium transporter|nr:magnesium transporter [Lachnospiraceae bacterium]MCI1397147.1 magnesium transporter [Lachnospiraceae bacterium]MCI1422785.1 magnesium transporter [Lachnospiraceae bacterium]MCI1451526.1 magnesium transporter [Lachnospiraceae bacterium]